MPIRSNERRTAPATVRNRPYRRGAVQTGPVDAPLERCPADHAGAAAGLSRSIRLMVSGERTARDSGLGPLEDGMVAAADDFASVSTRVASGLRSAASISAAVPMTMSRRQASE